MTASLHHINCGSLIVSHFGYVPCRGLLIVGSQGLALVDTGIGLQDIQDPVGRLGQELIDLAGFQFNEHDTAFRQIEKLGYQPSDVRHIILTHADPDHTGGLADFPQATVHISQEEFTSVSAGGWRYRLSHFSHQPQWRPHAQTNESWFGVPSRSLTIEPDTEIFLIPLFGHTHGHCGVAIQHGERWLLHVGDAIYVGGELDRDDHPVSALAELRADDNQQRLQSINELRRLLRDHREQIDLCCYHEDSRKASAN